MPISHYRRGLLVVAVMLAVTACVSPAPSTSPSLPSPTASPSSPGRPAVGTWEFATVAQPDVVTQAPSLEPGYHCSPCHPAAASALFGITATAAGFLAVGVQQPPAVAIAVASPDGRTWTPLPWDPGERTTAIAAAYAGDRTVVVGSGPDGAAAWVLQRTWTAASPDGLDGMPGATAMTAVVAGGDGFVAGGYRDDPLHAKASAAAWTSRDGLTWLDEGPASVFAGGRIGGLAARGDIVVAVGTEGDPTYGPAAAWVRSGGTWRRAAISDAGGAMHAVAATPDGFVAVGQNANDDGARVWTSNDGTTWTPLDDQPAFHALSGPIRMLSVAADAAGLAAGGWTSDAGNGSSAAWTSADGRTWQQVPWVPVFSGGEMPGIALTSGATLGVGRSGYPDNNQAAAWVAPRP
jgi:hypothetical protein